MVSANVLESYMGWKVTAGVVWQVLGCCNIKQWWQHWYVTATDTTHWLAGLAFILLHQGIDPVQVTRLVQPSDEESLVGIVAAGSCYRGSPSTQ